MHDRHHNGLKTAALLGLLSAVILVVGELIAGGGGLVIAAIVALGINAVSYFYGDRFALRSMRAYPVSQAQQPQLYGIVADLARAYRMPMPRLYLSPTPSPNAFATGRNPRHASVCVTQGLMGMMDARELRGVLGHELSHVANRDILIASVAGALATVILFLSRLAMFAAFFGFGGGLGRGRGRNNLLGDLMLIVLGPIAAILVQTAISRAREYQADSSGARVTGDPLALASALRKLAYGTQAAPLPANTELASTAAMMIANPFRRPTGWHRLFATHPPIEDRIRRLEELAGNPGPGPFGMLRN